MGNGGKGAVPVVEGVSCCSIWEFQWKIQKAQRAKPLDFACFEFENNVQKLHLILALKQERINNLETFDSHIFFADTLFVLDVCHLGIGFHRATIPCG